MAGTNHGAEVVNYYGFSVANFWLPALDVCLINLNQRVLYDNAHPGSEHDPWDAQLMGLLAAGEFSQVVPSFFPKIGKVIGGVLRLPADGPDGMPALWLEELTDWKAGYPVARPDPYLLKASDTPNENPAAAIGVLQDLAATSQNQAKPTADTPKADAIAAGGIGLGVVAAIGLAVWLALRKRK